MSASQNIYGSMSDASLSRLAKGGDNKAFNELAARYLGVIGHIARRFSAGGYDHRDFVQEGLVGLLYACKTYDEGGGSSFKSYLSVVTERRFVSIIRRDGNRRAVPRSSLVAIDEADGCVQSAGQSPEELVLCRERLEELLEHMKRKLSAAEYAVMTLYAGGRSYKEIAKKLSISEKSVDNALQRARKKLNPVLN